MARGKHAPKRAKLRLPLSAYLSYLLLASFLLTGVSFAAYISTASGGDSATVAAFELDNYDFMNDLLSLTFEDKPAIAQEMIAKTNQGINLETHQYSGNNDPTPDADSYVQPVEYTINGQKHTIDSFVRNEGDRRNSAVLLYTENPEPIHSEITDENGFAFEAAFGRPDPSKYHYDIGYEPPYLESTIFSTGGASGYGVVLQRTAVGEPWDLCVYMKEIAPGGSTKVTMPLDAIEGDYFHIVAVYDRAHKEFRAYLNGKHIGTAEAKGSGLYLTNAGIIGFGCAPSAINTDVHLTNITNKPSFGGQSYTAFKLYASPYSDADAKRLYNIHLVDMGVIDDKPEYEYLLHRNTFWWNFESSTTNLSPQGGKTFYVRNYDTFGNVSQVALGTEVVVTLSEKLPPGFTIHLVENSTKVTFTEIKEDGKVYVYTNTNAFQAGVKKERSYNVVVTAHGLYINEESNYITATVDANVIQVD